MRIAMFTNTYLPHVGGVARSVSSLCEDLRALGHEVIVVAPTFPGADRVFELIGDVVRVPALQNFNGSDFSVRLPVPGALNSLLDDLEIDLVHSHHPFLLGDTAVRVARRYDLPLLFTHHTRYEEYTHYISSDSPRMQEFAARLATEYGNLCSCVIAPSESIAELIRSRGVCVPVEVVATGVDSVRFAQHDRYSIRRELGVSDDTLIIGHVGRLAAEKNLEFLARCAACVLKRLPRSVFIVAGEGPAQAQMARVLDRAAVADRAFFLGNCQGQRLVDVFAAMDCFVFTSRTETQGMVLTEAMAAGTPVVALDAAGAREVVDDSNGQLLASTADPETFADAVIAVLGREDLDAGIRATAQRYSRDRTTHRMLSIYREYIHSHQTSTAQGDHLEALLARMTTEWELIVEKASVAIQTLSDS